ncbi:FAD-dependent oxidoreductase [Streptomyces mirabilis]|uniref:FAD-dependent oxidoreductase n=1 Tax=Streptomyces mirabilis TaxID=68239 RepID=UPI0036D1432C
MALWSQVLRSILMLGLEERIHYGKAAIGVTDIGDRAILAFADGTTAHADIVIGADGANSALRAHATPGREPVELPVAAIYGRSPIETLPKELSDSGVLALEGAPGRGAFFASMQYREAPAGQEPETLHAFARTLAADLHPVIRRMVEQGDPGSLIQTFMRAAQRPTTWTMPHVTLLGDAAHLMPPCSPKSCAPSHPHRRSPPTSRKWTPTHSRRSKHP